VLGLESCGNQLVQSRNNARNCPTAVGWSA
jgi:hypothetical protein